MADLAQRWRDLVSGRSSGLRASLGRAALCLAEVPYSCAMRLRNWRYDSGRAEIKHVDAPVICVGNLTMGGTGKTPMVSWLAQHLRDRGLRVAIVSRGYGAEAGARNDEALELEQRLPDVPHLQNPNRHEAAQTAVEEFAAEVVVLDDGFQHRRLARDFDLVLLDAADPTGLGHVFPRGMLREPFSGIVRADAVVLSRADMLPMAERATLHSQVSKISPDAVWAEAVHRPQRLLASSGAAQPLGHLAGKRVAAFCGIGNPAGFRHSLEQCGYQVAELMTFTDHHAYSRGDVEELTAWARTNSADAVVCTHKDLVKIGVDQLGGVPLWALAIGLEFTAGQGDLIAAIDAVLPVDRNSLA
ncbi:MAG: tetraacyldisaccharide 4'-kinase [Planctomycetes bacterium]|nr:tetraacyldisaccharide 4'-kinase [Planctomycetota bacterium]